MSKLVKCKSCGAEIAKTAKRCPKCGAQQHIAALTACYLIVLLAIGLCVFVLLSGDSESSPAAGSSAQVQQTAVSNGKDVFSGDFATVSFVDAYTVDGIAGCFYVALDVTNNSSVDQMVYLTDAFADGTTCNTGSGIPVTVMPGKTTTGAFIFFYNGEFDSVQEIGFKVNIADNASMNVLETSEEIKVSIG